MRWYWIIVFCLVSAVVYAQNFDVLVLEGNVSHEEFPVLEKFINIEGFQFRYEKTSDRSLPGLKSFDILWIGQGEICENAYFLQAETEQAIKDFVLSGGVVICIGQDSDDGRPCEAGWLPVPLGGVERGGTEVFEITDAPEVGDLFERPNQIQQAHYDDAWTDPDPSIILLSTINNGQDVGIGLLKHGMGYYLITSLENESADDVSVNTPIMENLLLYAAQLIQNTAVEPGSRLSLLWAEIK